MSILLNKYVLGFLAIVVVLAGIYSSGYMSGSNKAELEQLTNEKVIKDANDATLEKAKRDGLDAGTGGVSDDRYRRED